MNGLAEQTRPAPTPEVPPGHPESSLPVTVLVAERSKYQVLDEPSPIRAEIDTLDGGSGDSDTI